MSDLADNFSSMVNDNQFSDIEFKIQDKPVYAHKAILCARSDYFRAMFSNKMKETFAKVKVKNYNCCTYFSIRSLKIS